VKTLIVYDSFFGNTEKIALEIGAALGERGEVETLPVSQATPEKVGGLDLLIVGSPTRGFRPTEAISKFLNSLSKEQLAGLGVVAFDTRIALETIDSAVFRLVVDKGGYAASTIGKALKKKGGTLLAPPEGFLVTGEQGPLKDGELERAKEWARQLWSLVQGKINR
jgi:flavodoxin